MVLYWSLNNYASYRHTRKWFIAWNLSSFFLARRSQKQLLVDSSVSMGLCQMKKKKRKKNITKLSTNLSIHWPVCFRISERVLRDEHQRGTRALHVKKLNNCEWKPVRLMLLRRWIAEIDFFTVKKSNSSSH